jgi:hypothetical protein
MRFAELLERFGYAGKTSENRTAQDEVLVVDIRGSLPPRHFVEQKLALVSSVQVVHAEKQ